MLIQGVDAGESVIMSGVKKSGWVAFAKESAIAVLAVKAASTAWW